MADLKKFLDQAGVSTLWGKVAEEVAKVDAKAVENAGKITVLEGKVDALEKGTYDDAEVRELIAANTTANTFFIVIFSFLFGVCLLCYQFTTLLR